jgi:tRNA (guanine-N7-)-methyltransferase
MEIDFNKYPLPRRFRHHTSSNLYLPANEQKILSENYPPLINNIHWEQLYQNAKPPNSLDIGCGRGKFLLNYSEKYPDINILGIELRQPVADWLDNYIKRENLPNAAVIWYSVVNGLGFIEDNSINNIFYLFPDPWHKRKHHKRRAFNRLIIGEYYRILKTGAYIYISTDVPEVNTHHIKILNEFKLFNYNIITNNNDWDLPITNKENFCIEKNIPVYRIICKK